MSKNTKDNKINRSLAREEDLQEKCPDKAGISECGSCQGCSGQRKKSPTIYYVIPALVILVIGLILKFFAII